MVHASRISRKIAPTAQACAGTRCSRWKFENPELRAIHNVYQTAIGQSAVCGARGKLLTKCTRRRSVHPQVAVPNESYLQRLSDGGRHIRKWRCQMRATHNVCPTAVGAPAGSGAKGELLTKCIRRRSAHPQVAEPEESYSRSLSGGGRCVRG